MPAEARVLSALAVAALVTLVATPLVIRLARRIGFYDRPHGYKAHAAATPYLGGAAVMVGFLLGTVAMGDTVSRYWPVLVGASVLWLVGTSDDRRFVSPLVRVLAELAAAALLWVGGLGWSAAPSETVNAALTAFWVIGIVNSFNLMDNMDGVGGMVAAASCAGIAALALVHGDPVRAALTVALLGACIGFLRYNLTSPARVFLGDGGSMPIGFVIAAASMAASGHDLTGWPGLLAALLIVGIPVLDTTLVVVSRCRRGVSVVAGGRDHISHRLRRRLPSARAVAFVLLWAQLGLAAMAVAASELGENVLVAVMLAYLALAAAVVGVLERSPWATPEPQRLA